MESYMNIHISSQKDETIVYPFGTLDKECKTFENEDEIVFTEIRFGNEEFERILNTNLSEQKPLMSNEEYESEFIQNQEYERQAREYELMLKRRSENEENGIFEDDYSDDEDEYVDTSYMYYDRC